MALVKLVTSASIFFVLYGLCDYWYPLISWLVNILVIACISWIAGRRVCRHLILKSILPRVPASDKAVLITGCDSGFGHMLALKLNSLGFYVFAGCLHAEGEGAAELMRLSVHKARMKTVQLNVTKQEEVDQAHDVVSQFLLSNDQGIRCLFAVINNAGIADGALIEWSPSSLIADYERVMDINFYGVLRITRKFLPFVRKCRGRIVNLSSILGRTSIIGLNMYSVSKAATAKLTEGLMSEMGPFGVTVIDINPWFYKTPMLSADRILSNMNKAWTSADDEVRASYGGQSYYDYFSKACVFTVTDPTNVSQDPEEVVDALLDAVTSYEPDTVYRLISPGFGIIFWIVNDFLPWDLLIHVRRIIDNLPTYLAK